MSTLSQILKKTLKIVGRNRKMLVYGNRSEKLFSRGIQTTSHLDKIVAFNLSDIGEGIREVVIKEWFIKEGAKVAQFDEICEVQSDKASVTITSRYDGIIKKIHHQVNDIAKVGQPLVDMDVIDTSSDQEDTNVETSSSDSSSSDEESEKPKNYSPQILAIPSVRKFAKDNQVDLSLISGTGKDGRIEMNDVVQFLGQKPKPVMADTISERIEPIRGFTRAMVKTMTESLKIPHFVYSDEVSLTKLVIIRNEIKQLAQEKGYRITYMPFFIKAASLALAQLPVLNSSVDDNCENIIYHKNHNIGIAMDTPNGLVVPNIKQVQDKSLAEIIKDLMRLQELGAKGTLSNDDLSGGTFSLSNIGIVGGTYTKPVILPPQVAIGAIGKTQILPRFDENLKVVPEHILNVSWAADHRVIDGVTMARFSNTWKNYLENPSLLLTGL